MGKFLKINKLVLLPVLLFIIIFSISAAASAAPAESTDIPDAEIYYSISTYRVYYRSTEHIYSADSDVTQETLETMESYYMMLPDWVRDVFEDNGWYLWVMDSFEEFGYGDNTAGLTDYNTKCVYIKNRSNDISINVLFHEIGHVMDYELGTRMTRLSQTEEFKSLFEEYWDDFCSVYNYSHFQVNEKELFAEACYFYWTDPYKLQTEFPEIFGYIDTAFTDYSGISVLDYFPVNGLYDLFGSMTYYTDGRTDRSFTGFAECKNNGGMYYVTNGYMIKRDGILQDTSTDTWYYVVDGKVQSDYTGVGNFKNQYGWWYIKNGKVDFSRTGIEPNDYGWWRVVNGKVDFSSNSIEQNDYGWWYLTGGKVDFGYTGVGNYCNAYGWWYIKDGKVDFGRTGIDPNTYGWWRVKNGKVDFSCNSVEQNNYGWWLVENGKVNFDYTGVSNHENSYGWWYIRNGEVDFGYTGLGANRYGTWYVRAGKVDFSFTGTAYGRYIRSGRAA